MPYKEDGETWSNDVDVHDEGMAENRPGHKSFSAYNLPGWVKHPLAHPFSGVVLTPKEYMYSAGDGFSNPLGWSIGHVGAKFGDVGILEKCTPEELSRPSVDGQTPAHYCVQFGTSWCLQWLAERGVDIATPDLDGVTPAGAIWRNPKLHAPEKEWLLQALKGELTEKNSVKAQEYHLVKNRAPGNDPLVTARLDKDMDKLRKYWFGTGNWANPYSPPTEGELVWRPLDLPVSKVAPVARRQAPLPAALLFPGQGSQYVGMLKEVLEKPSVKAMLEKAEQILGWSPTDICLNGPEEKLSQTRYCQPVMYIAGLAALELLKETNPEVVERPQCVAGLSSGELTAAVCAGVIDFEDGLRLVKVRAEAMQRAAELQQQAMCSVAGLDRARLDGLCAEARSSDTVYNAECAVAAHLFPNGFTCSGTEVAIHKVCELAQAAGALQARKFSSAAAFHTRLMRPALEELSEALDELADRMQPPRCDIYLNATGARVGVGAAPGALLEPMRLQLTSEVLWEPCVAAMIKDGVADFFEVGPLRQISSMIKRIDPGAFKRTQNVSV